ncbi:dTDP-4-amino-4,6-dideoxygalactose transaminase [Arenibacter antarcticus]|uniref:dTDP-4-amino-4,6-dideoxygalactose transaminase n=1 Tax=Arenibacter antarcticus TaxID=2040469 RepID=A0ABW5VAW8_9FLAO|nr:dTDP-4-amino-4,6-dideoxygalactose transaminase [Arenibacter sp. H213]MCM4167879.1 dTDP-4-amino-4,6-dideoxygalactose transaminase [Arenibacter sp. H213]
MNYKTPFNKPHLTGSELDYISDAVTSGKISGNGKYTVMCQELMQKKYGFGKCLLTTSCTDALEMAAILIDVKPGDEIIMPSYTFVSTANAFVLRGAKIVFVDSRKDRPGMDEDLIQQLITKKTKAIVPVHYAGVSCDMDKIMEVADAHNVFVIEDAAQAIDSYYTDKYGNKKALGSIGHMATFSFHETKNIISGEGGMLVINDSQFKERAEIIWEKGTNRSSFFRGEVDKYGWVDIGSSFLPSDIIAAFLYAQLESIEKIQNRRIEIWKSYSINLREWASKNRIALPIVPEFATNNAHMFYLVFNNIEERTTVINALKKEGILSVFHYLSLHKSPFYELKHDGRELPMSDHYTNCLLRLPMFYNLSDNEIQLIIKTITKSI